MVTLYDLSIDLALEEGVSEFEDLGLGPLLCHKLVVQYFSPPAGVPLHKITTLEVIEHLARFVPKFTKSALSPDAFASFLTNRLSVPSVAYLHIRLQDLRYVIS
jgi:hypothetical protein